MHAIPNGGQRNIVVATKLKAEGVKSGVPDVCLPLPRGGYHGLYLELKVGRNKATDNQAWWIDQLECQGYKALVVWGFAGARAAILEYLDPQPCGHPRAAIGGNGTTHYCVMCESEAK